MPSDEAFPESRRRFIVVQGCFSSVEKTVDMVAASVRHVVTAMKLPAVKVSP